MAGTHKSYASSSVQISLRGDDQFVNWHNEVQLVTGKTLFNVVHQSVEAFRTTTDVRDLRASRGESGQGIQAGADDSPVSGIAAAAMVVVCCLITAAASAG